VLRDGATVLGQDTRAPYSFTWGNVPHENHQLTARATDNAGAITPDPPGREYHRAPEALSALGQLRPVAPHLGEDLFSLVDALNSLCQAASGGS
jgi:hypothetical protein